MVCKKTRLAMRRRVTGPGACWGGGGWVLALGEPGRAEGTGGWPATPREWGGAGSRVQGDTGSLSQPRVQSAEDHRGPRRDIERGWEPCVLTGSLAPGDRQRGELMKTLKIHPSS